MKDVDVKSKINIDKDTEALQKLLDKINKLSVQLKDIKEAFLKDVEEENTTNKPRTV